MLKSLFKSESEHAVRPAKVVEDPGDDCAPIAWEGFFDRTLRVDGPNAGEWFQCFVSGELREGEVCCLLLHGAGHSSLVWAVLARKLKELGHAVVAYDCRGHGLSSHADETQLSKNMLAEDCAFVAKELITQTGLSGIILIGHSMGGAIAVHAARLPSLAGVIKGLVVMDLVEGTALASIAHILGIINSRPKTFTSPAQAVRWVVDSSAVRSIDSARISVPGQLRRKKVDEAAGDDDDSSSGEWEWRTDLLASRDYWREWYENLSALFLGIPIPKLLMLAGADRLDTPLTIGQMQGKYMLQVVPQSGHQLQEDAPDDVAEKLHLFVKRF